MPKRSSLLIASLAALLSVVAWPGTAHPQDEYDALRERLDGTWRLDGSVEEAERVRDRAAERAASAFNVFIRGIAGSRLRDGADVSRRITLRFDDERRVHVRFDQSRYASAFGETARVRRPDGTTLQLTQRARDGNLEQVFQGEGGTRWYVYEPTGTDTLRVSSTINSDRMPQPMHFALDYRRD